MTRDFERRGLDESFRPEDLAQKSSRPAGGQSEPTIVNSPVDIGGGTIVKPPPKQDKDKNQEK